MNEVRQAAATLRGSEVVQVSVDYRWVERNTGASPSAKTAWERILEDD